jgi:hypothetical protein
VPLLVPFIRRLTKVLTVNNTTYFQKKKEKGDLFLVSCMTVTHLPVVPPGPHFPPLPSHLFSTSFNALRRAFPIQTVFVFFVLHSRVPPLAFNCRFFFLPLFRGPSFVSRVSLLLGATRLALAGKAWIPSLAWRADRSGFPILLFQTLY